MELLKISAVKPNTDNPRVIRDNKFQKLVASIKEFPEMLKLRPIVVNKDMIILGGNMRYKACIEAGLKEVWVLKAEDLTEEQEKEFIVKDNVGFGEWDWDILANIWDTKKLKDWGLDVWQPEEEIDYSVLDDIDLSETLDNKEAGVKRAIMIEFDPKHYDKANELITQARKDGKDVGLIVLNAFKNEL
tara:strand:+ start:43 stop:606 length:564 start_codon:yes stop_codon:yes gene_type:complete